MAPFHFVCDATISKSRRLEGGMGLLAFWVGSRAEPGHGTHCGVQTVQCGGGRPVLAGHRCDVIQRLIQWLAACVVLSASAEPVMRGSPVWHFIGSAAGVNQQWIVCFLFFLFLLEGWFEL